MAWSKVRMAVLLSSALNAASSSAGEAEKGMTNIARGAGVTAFSSLEQSGWLPPASLTDGNKGGLGWCSKAFADFADHALYPEWVAIDLGRHWRIERVDLYPRGDGANAGQGFPEDFTIAVCAEGEPWQTVLEHKGYAQPKTAEAQSFAVAPRVARYVRVQATRLRPGNGKHYFQLSEVEVFAAPAEAPAAAAPAVAAVAAAPAELRCEYRVNPVGVDRPRPHLSWTMRGTARGEKQTAYRVLAASSATGLDKDGGYLWDSGKVESDHSVGVEYAGRALASGESVFWKVMLWDRQGKPTAWSEPARFIVGKLKAEDWAGKWIGADEDPKHAAVYLRKEVRPAKAVKRATAFMSGLGWSELFINGAKVSDWMLTPGNTCYQKRVPYVVHDVTGYFAGPGAKVLAVVLGDGWYAIEKDPWVHRFEKLPYVDKPKLLLDVELEYEDGTRETLRSDETWKWSYGEITYNWVAMEHVDMRRAKAGWDRPGYDDAAWKAAALVKAPAGRLVVQTEPPTRVLATLKAQKLTRNEKTGAWTFDFGREFQGFVRLRTKGPAGTAVTMTLLGPRRHAEGHSPYVNRFTLAGGGIEEYSPRFHYNAIGVVDVAGLAEPPTLDTLIGCQVNADLQPAGQFRCSSDTVTWIDECVRRTQMNYVTGFPNDPTREKKGWTQDIETMLQSSCFLLDSQTLYERWFWDISDGQDAKGNCPNVTPGPFYDAYNSPWWGGCMVWGPWYWYRFYGDRRVLADHYDAMRKYVDFLTASAKDGVQDWGLMDWLPVEETPRVLINTPAHILYARIAAQSAEILGHKEDAAKYAQLSESIRSKVNEKFLDRKTGVYSVPGWKPRQGTPGSTPLKHRVWWQEGEPTCTQGAQALALAMGIVPDDARERAATALLKEIEAHDGFVSTGFVSTPYLLDTLMDLDPQAAWTMTTKTPAPGWYAMTIGSDNDLQREQWHGGAALMPSLGGQITQWHFQCVGGIRAATPGFKAILIQPNVVGDLHWVECHYDSVHGRIESNWQLRSRELTMDVVIPANTTATVYVPSAGGAEAITESGKPLAQAEGVRVLRVEGGRTVLACEAGAYRFTAALPPRPPAKAVELPQPQPRPQPKAIAKPAPGPTIPKVFEP